MLSEARNALPGCHFIEADISAFQTEEPVDLLYANASLQWVPDHYQLFPHPGLSAGERWRIGCTNAG